MGLDLKVMASHFRERRGEVLSTATLRFDRDTGIFTQLARDAVPCLVHELPPGVVVGCYEDEGLRYTDTDARGNRLTYTTPREIAALVLGADTAPWNLAIASFLRALPAGTQIFLYWC